MQRYKEGNSTQSTASNRKVLWSQDYDVGNGTSSPGVLR